MFAINEYDLGSLFKMQCANELKLSFSLADSFDAKTNTNGGMNRTRTCILKFCNFLPREREVTFAAVNYS